jgi:NAD(P)-dependent dehydrogenase (short-subunit alcohol dehydrogenase family)
MNRFNSQVAIITGGAQGIGLAIAQRILSEGSKVWLFDTSESLLTKAVEQIISIGGEVRGLIVDITNESSVIDGFEKVISVDSKVDIMINSAGIVGPNGIKADEVKFDSFKRTLDVNLNGAFLMTKYALKAMIPNKYGRILLIASIAGKEGNAGMCAYSASKAAVIGLAKSVGKEYAETGITINALAPATIMTSMVQSMKSEQIKYMTDKIPMKRCGELYEVASLAAWIVSYEASFNTGFTFDLTGGRSVY